jgi:hypothetical protein
MAKLNKSVLGKVSGAVGDILFRQREGKNYIGLKPGSFIPGTDPASIERRQRFLLALKSGSSVNSVSELKDLWADVTPAGNSPFNYIVKTNYRYVTSTTVSDLLPLVPDGGFGVTLSDSNIDRTRVRMIIDPIGSNAGINTLLEPNIMAACVMFLSTPLDESVGAYSLLNVVSASQPVNLTQQLSFDANLTSQQQVIFDKYQDKKTFAAFITLDAAGASVHYSSTALLA